MDVETIKKKRKQMGITQSKPNGKAVVSQHTNIVFTGYHWSLYHLYRNHVLDDIEKLHKKKMKALTHFAMYSKIYQYPRSNCYFHFLYQGGRAGHMFSHYGNTLENQLINNTTLLVFNEYVPDVYKEDGDTIEAFESVLNIYRELLEKGSVPVVFVLVNRDPENNFIQPSQFIEEKKIYERGIKYWCAIQVSEVNYWKELHEWMMEDVPKEWNVNIFQT